MKPSRFRDAASRATALAFLEPHAARYGLSGTTRDAIIILALRLAADLPVPKEKKRPGAKRKWTAELLLRLVVEVKRFASMTTKGGIGRRVTGACRMLATEEPWRGLVKSRREPWRALREIFQRQTAGWAEQQAAMAKRDGKALRAAVDKHRHKQRGLADSAVVLQDRRTRRIKVIPQYVGWKPRSD